MGSQRAGDGWGTEQQQQHIYLQCCVSFSIVIHGKVTQLYIFQILFHFRLSQDIECSSVCHTVGPRWLSILFIFFRPSCVACRILVPQPGMKSIPRMLGVWSHNHWTTREVPPFKKIIIWLFFNCDGSSLLHGGFSSLLCAGFSLQGLLLLQSTDSRRGASVVTVLSNCGSRALEPRLSSCGTWT